MMIVEYITKYLKYALSVMILALAVVVGPTATLSHAESETNSASSNSSANTAGIYASPATNSIVLHNGQTYAGQMTIKNLGSAPANITVAPGAYTIENDNYDAPNYNDPGKYSLMSQWIKVDRSSFVLNGGESTVINYTVTAPANPPAGTQYAMLFATSSPVSQSGQSGVQASMRTGTIIMANMADGKTVNRTSVTEQKIDGYQPDSPLISSLKVKNEGNAGASVEYSMTVKGLNGSEVYSTNKSTLVVYPETSRSFDMEWDKVGIGIYRVEQNVKINGSDHSIKKLVVAVPAWIIGLVVIGILTLIAFTVLNIRTLRKQSQPRRQSKRSARHVAQNVDRSANHGEPIKFEKATSLTPATEATVDHKPRVVQARRVSRVGNDVRQATDDESMLIEKHKSKRVVKINDK